MTCLRCGAENPEKARYCGICGDRLSSPGAYVLEKSGFLSIAILAIFLFVGGTWIVGSRAGDENLDQIQTMEIAGLEGVSLKRIVEVNLPGADWQLEPGPQGQRAVRVRGWQPMRSAYIELVLVQEPHAVQLDFSGISLDGVLLPEHEAISLVQSWYQRCQNF